MSPQDDDYLVLAKRADQAAAEAQTSIAKNTWNAMAQEYRALAVKKSKASPPKKIS